MVLGLVLGAAVPAAMAFSALTAGRSAALQATDALADARLAQADEQFWDAADHFGRGEALMRTPVLRGLRIVPFIGGELRAVSALAEAGRLAALAATDVSGAVLALPGGMGALAPHDGRVPIERLAALAAPFEAASGRLSAAEDLVAHAAGARTGRVRQARQDLADRLAQALRSARVGHALGEALPGFLGADGHRRYLVAAQNPAELRGTGGFVGAFAILSVVDGRVEFGEFEAIQELPNLPVEQIQAPHASFASRYDRYGGAGFWMNINMTPDFPSAAEAMVELYERVRSESLDGVIAADPHALAALLAVTGPLEVPEVGWVDGGSVVDVVSNEAYAGARDHDERKEMLGSVAASAFQRLFDGGAATDPLAAVEALGGAVARGNLMFYAVDGREQAAFETAGASGALGPADGDFLAVVGNNAAANKVDFYVDRTVRYRVRLQPDGSAQARTTIEFHNGAPSSGQPAYVIGPSVEGLDAGDNRTIVSVYCAQDCDLQDYRRSSGTERLRQEQELGHAVFTTSLTVESGASESVQLDWRVPQAWTPMGSGGRYRLVFRDQPTIRPTRLVVEVEAPDGRLVSLRPAGQPADPAVPRWEGEPLGRMEFVATWD